MLLSRLACLILPLLVSSKTCTSQEACMMIIVPQGCWHRFESEFGVQLMTVTPQPTDHTGADDPTDTDEDRVL